MAKGKKCAIPGCEVILNEKAGRICQKHRSRFRRHGDYDISPNWPNLKAGIPSLSPLGYYRITINGKRIMYHRYIMEQHLGRKLYPSERVHHINGDTADNNIENLELFANHSEHQSKCHPNSWKSRKKYPPYDSNTIGKILERLSISSCGRGKKPIFEICFCGNKQMARNLCSKHFQWAYDHNFI